MFRPLPVGLGANRTLTSPWTVEQLRLTASFNLGSTRLFWTSAPHRDLVRGTEPCKKQRLKDVNWRRMMLELQRDTRFCQKPARLILTNIVLQTTPNPTHQIKHKPMSAVIIICWVKHEFHSSSSPPEIDFWQSRKQLPALQCHLVEERW